MPLEPVRERAERAETEEEFVKLQEVLRTCSNPHVADAALRSIGGDLATAVTAEARRRGEPRGQFVSGLARDFELTAGTCVWACAAHAMQGADQPVLAGFRVVVAHGLLERNLRRPARDHRELMVA